MRRHVFSLALTLAVGLVLLSHGAASADDVFAVSGIHVDASAASATEAQNAAIAQGRPRAWQILFRRIARAQDWPRQPMLDDAQLQRVIRGFEVSNERRSTTRYVADITYRFNPDAVARVLQAAGIAYTQIQAKRVLVVPMAPAYARGSAWTAALASPRFSNNVVPFSVPAGDALDQGALAALSFDTASWADVEPAASRLHASEAVLMLATPVAGHLTIVLKRLGPGQLPVKASVDVPLVQGGVPSTYSAAADAAVRSMEEMWKTRSAVDFSQKGRLIADVRIASLGQWGSLQTTLAAVPNVSGVTVLAMDIGEARVSLSYLGTTDQLREALAAQGIALTNHGAEWSLSPAPVQTP
jgi:hypothetical protein